MRIAWFDESHGYHTIDKVREGLVKLGHEMETHKYFSKAVAQKANIVFVDFFAENADRASNSDFNAPLIVRLSAMELYKGKISTINWDNIDLAIMQGEHLKNYYREQRKGTLPAEKIVILPSAIDTDYFHMRSQPTKNDRIAVVSQIHWRKGSQLIPEVLMAIPKQYKIKQIGKLIDRDCKNYLDNEIRRLKLQNRYSYDGTTGNVPGWLDDKAYFLLPSYTEGLPRACGEAMSMGLRPMIHYYRGAEKQWPSKYIWHKVEEIAEMLEEDYDPNEYRDYIANNRSIEIVAKEMEALCYELLAENQ